MLMLIAANVFVLTPAVR